MEVTTWEELVSLGPCPACLNYQLDYRPQDFTSYEECVETVEAALHEHLDECRHLQLLLGPEFSASRATS